VETFSLSHVDVETINAAQKNKDGSEKEMAKGKQDKTKVERPTTPAGKLNARGRLMVRQLPKIAKAAGWRKRPSIKQVEALREAIQEKLDASFDALVAALKEERAVEAEETFEPVVEDDDSDD